MCKLTVSKGRLVKYIVAYCMSEAVKKAEDFKREGYEVHSVILMDK